MKGPRLTDFGGISEEIEELKFKCLLPILNPKLKDHLGQKNWTVNRVLLHGPSGCGKTSLAEAVINEARVPSHTISVRELMSEDYRVYGLKFFFVIYFFFCHLLL